MQDDVRPTVLGIKYINDTGGEEINSNTKNLLIKSKDVYESEDCDLHYDEECASSVDGEGEEEEESSDEEDVSELEIVNNLYSQESQQPAETYTDADGPSVHAFLIIISLVLASRPSRVSALKSSRMSSNAEDWSQTNQFGC